MRGGGERQTQRQTDRENGKRRHAKVAASTQIELFRDIISSFIGIIACRISFDTAVGVK